MTLTPTIVTLNTQVTAAPAPSTYQQSACIISVGATALSAGSSQYCGTLAAVQALLNTSGNYVEVGNMATTFFAQGQAVGVSVLELGSQGSGSAAITALQNWVNANPGVFYVFVCPATWDSNGAALNTMAANFSAPTSMMYFVVTTTQGTISAYAPTTKAIFAVVDAPTVAAGEFTAAAFAYNMVVNNPSSASPMGPLAYRFLYGVTNWVTSGNSAAINAILTAYGNLVLTGSEANITNACVFKGTTIDGTQFGWWYGIDWLQLNAKLALAGDVINGSNSNPPLLYNQVSINTLLGDLEVEGANAVAAGLILSATFSAVPFTTYTTQNPNDYKAGRYNGFSCVAVGQNGFLTLQFNLDATQFAA